MRIRWIDIAKGIAILLVCAGHTRLGVEGPIASWITSFHMPLFFVMAGLCFEEGRYRSLVEYVVRKCRALAYPYFMLTVFVALLLTVFSFGLAGNCLESMLIKVFPGQNVIGFWFIRTLFLVEIFYAILSRLPSRVRITTIVVLGIFGFYLPSGHDLLRMNTVCISLMFYEIGCLCRPLRSRKYGLTILIGVAVGGSLLQGILLWNSRFPVCGFGASRFHYNGVLVILVALLGTLAVAVESQVVDRIPRVGSAFAWLGRNSLALLALHPNVGICRSYWIEQWPILAGWKSIALEILMIVVFMWLLSGPLNFLVKMPRFRLNSRTVDSK